MKALYTIDLVLEVAADALGHDRDAVFVTLCAEDVYLAAFQIDVLDPEPDAFHQPQAGSVKNSRHQQVGPLHLIENAYDFVLGQNHRKPGAPFGSRKFDQSFDRDVEHSFVEEHDGVEGLALRGRGNLPFGCQVTQKSLDLCFAHVLWVGLCPVKFHIPQDPVHIGLLGPICVMVIPQYLLHLVHEPKPGVGSEFRLCFHTIVIYQIKMEKRKHIFPFLAININCNGNICMI